MADRAAPLPADFEQAVARRASDLAGFVGRIHYYSEAGSTNDIAAALAGAGSPEGTLVLAASQTAGRGRQGRRWHSPPGAGLYFSVVLRPRESGEGPDAAGGALAEPQTSLVTLMAGEAVADAIAGSTGLDVTLKWPNDLIVDTARAASGVTWRKLGGILAEAAIAGASVQHLVLGIGINLRDTAYPEGLARATSIEAELGREVDAAELFAACLAALARGRSDLLEGRAGLVLDRWRRRAPSSVGRRVTWQAPDGPRSGVTRGVDDTGALLVDRDGCVDRVIAGDVSWS